MNFVCLMFCFFCEIIIGFDMWVLLVSRSFLFFVLVCFEVCSCHDLPFKMPFMEIY